LEFSESVGFIHNEPVMMHGHKILKFTVYGLCIRIPHSQNSFYTVLTTALRSVLLLLKMKSG